MGWRRANPRIQPASEGGGAIVASSGGEAIPQPVGREFQPCDARGRCWLTAEPLCWELEGGRRYDCCSLNQTQNVRLKCVCVCTYSSRPTSERRSVKKKVCPSLWSCWEWITTGLSALLPQHSATWRWTTATRSWSVLTHLPSTCTLWGLFIVCTCVPALSPR